VNNRNVAALEGFLKDCCVIGNHGTIGMLALHTMYVCWCIDTEQREKIMSIRELSQAIEDYGGIYPFLKLDKMHPAVPESAIYWACVRLRPIDVAAENEAVQRFNTLLGDIDIDISWGNLG
jgi:hypothetical protein